MYKWNVMSSFSLSKPSSAAVKMLSSSGLSQHFINSLYKNLCKGQRSGMKEKRKGEKEKLKGKKKRDEWLLVLRADRL